jgi:glycosyltransferase involved in cell wall biosynthesis
MIIAFVSQEYPRGGQHGGIGSQSYMKAHGMSARGHQVHVVTHSEDSNEHRTYESGVHVLRIPNLDRRLPIITEPVRWLSYSTCVADAVARLSADVQLDIIDFAEWGAEGYVHLLNQDTWHHIPSVIQLHGPLVMFAHTMGWPQLNSEFYRVGTHMEGTCLRLADAVFSSSRCSAEWCAKFYGLGDTEIPVIHTGIDTEVFKPPIERREERELVIIFVGKLVPNKGVRELVEAICRVAAEFPGLRLRLVGRDEGGMSQSLIDIARRRGHPELLELTGFIPRERLPAELGRADIFAAPSVYEGGPGFVYLEAMACGLPVIGCEGSGASEAIVLGTGLLVPPGDVEALSQALWQLLSDRALRQQMGEHARQHILAEADSKKCLDRLEAFYRSVVANVRARNDS